MEGIIYNLFESLKINDLILFLTDNLVLVFNDLLSFTSDIKTGKMLMLKKEESPKYKNTHLKQLY